MKRGIRARLDGGWAGIGLMVTWMILFGYFISGCAGISLKAPTTQILIKDATFLAGYEIGKAKPEIAAEILGYTTVEYLIEKDIPTFYEDWKGFVASKLKDPVHRRLVGTMLALVEIEIQLKIPIEQEKVIRELFREFITGLKVGIDAQN